MIPEPTNASAHRLLLAHLLRSAESGDASPRDSAACAPSDCRPEAVLALARRERIAALLHADGLRDGFADSFPAELRDGCESAYLRTLAANIDGWKVGRRMLGALRCRGIDVAPAGAWELLSTPLRYYPDFGARSLDEIELVIREKDRGRAESLLFEHGFRRVRDRAAQHGPGSSAFRGGEGETHAPVRLRWGWEGFAGQLDRFALAGGDFLDELCDTTVSGALRPTRVGDLLVASLDVARGGRGRWMRLVDLHRVVTSAPVHWPAIARGARRLRLRAPLYAGLVAARELLATPVPPEALARISPGPIRRRLIERRLFADQRSGAAASDGHAGSALLCESWWEVARGTARGIGAGSRRVGGATA